MKELKDIIKELIELKQEGSFWDFKREWYSKDKNENMLLDIICMANNLENRDAYIIIGVDEEKDFKIIDVTRDTKRKKTQDIVCILRDKEFAGDIRPTVTVETVIIDNNAIDVIIIHNTDKTPYYLKEDLDNVKANNIYTRVQDTNTPVNKSADIHHIELLWKKRFGLLLTPIEKCKKYLKDKENWEQWEFYKSIEYYKLYPEYTIEKNYDEEDTRNGVEYYMFNQVDMSPIWANVTIKYHQTVLFQSLMICLDGGRSLALSPDRKNIKIKNHEIRYGYMVKDSLRYILNEYLFEDDGDEGLRAHETYMKNILVFESENERLMFEEYAKYNWDDSCEKKIDEINAPGLPEDGLNYSSKEEDYRIVQVMKDMLREFRNSVREDK